MELWLLQRFSHFKGVSRHEKTRQVASLFLLSLLLIVRSIMTLNFLTRVELVGLHFFSNGHWTPLKRELLILPREAGTTGHPAGKITSFHQPCQPFN